MLITDPTHAIPVMVRRTGLRTIAYGTGAIDRLQLPNIPISADIKVGDELVTSGLGGRFPMGFEVGKIVEISNDEIMMAVRKGTLEMKITPVFCGAAFKDKGV